MSDKISFDVALSHQDIAESMLLNRKTRYLIRGPKGIGKSALLNYLAKRLPTHRVVPVDMAQMDVGDLKGPVVDRENQVMHYWPNADFGLHDGEPALINLDEFGKAPRDVQNGWHPILEIEKPRFCGRPINPDSIVFLTSNLDVEGLGDNLKSHTKDRLCELIMRAPTAEEWITNFAIPNKVHPTVLAMASERPQVFLTVLDGKDWEDSPYQQVTPRGLERVSDIMRNSYNKLRDEVILANVAGCVGTPFANDFSAFIKYQRENPKWEDVINNPMTAKLPEGQGAACVFVFGALTRVDKSSINAMTKYLSRFPAEWQAVFCVNLANQKQALAFSSEEFNVWLADNADLL